VGVTVATTCTGLTTNFQGKNSKMEIENIRDYLLRTYKPKAILFHGSRLRDDASPESDYDIVLVAPKLTDIYPHQYEDVMLDVSSAPLDVEIIEAGNKVPVYPLVVWYDTDGVGEKIYQRTEQAYKNGASALSEQEWDNRSNYTKRMIKKIEARGESVAIRQYYISDFYMRVIRYWFEKKRKWTVSPYRALPIIQAEDPLFFSFLENLWTENYLLSAHQIEQILFDIRD
jgi:predicted nucleotidyltransferase